MIDNMAASKLRTSWSLVERAIMQFIKSPDKFYAGQSLTDSLL